MYWTLVVNDIAYTPTRALGIYRSQEDAERAIEPWMRELGVATIPLATGTGIYGPETPYWPPPGPAPKLEDTECQARKVDHRLHEPGCWVLVRVEIVEAVDYDDEYSVRTADDDRNISTWIHHTDVLGFALPPDDLAERRTR